MAVITTTVSCSYDKELLTVPCVINDNVEFSTKVAPIIQSNCFSCHNNNVSEGNIVLEGYDNVKKIASKGKLLGVISHAPGFVPMPKDGNKLDDCSIEIIKTWIDNGMPNN